MKSPICVTNILSQQEADCFFQDCELAACDRAAVADAGRGRHVCARSDVNACDHYPFPRTGRSSTETTCSAGTRMRRCLASTMLGACS